METLKNNEVILFIAGDILSPKDKYREEILEIIFKKGLSSKVFLTGWLEREKFFALLLQTDLFVLPSFYEGIPNALLDALSVDLPCLGSNVPGIRDVLKFDELLFDPNNPEELKEKILSIMNNQEKYEHIRQLCKERKKSFIFDWKKEVVKLIKSFYAQKT